jgi:hypothetical protein
VELHPRAREDDHILAPPMLHPVSRLRLSFGKSHVEV